MTKGASEIYSVVTLPLGDWRIRGPDGEAFLRLNQETTIRLENLPWDRSQAFPRLSFQRER